MSSAFDWQIGRLTRRIVWCSVQRRRSWEQLLGCAHERLELCRLI